MELLQFCTKLSTFAFYIANIMPVDGLVMQGARASARKVSAMATRNSPLLVWKELTHWGRDKMADILQTAFSNSFFYENYHVWIWISLKFISKASIGTVNISGPRAALQRRRQKCGSLTGRVGYRFLSPVHHERHPVATIAKPLLNSLRPSDAYMRR